MKLPVTLNTDHPTTEAFQINTCGHIKNIVGDNLTLRPGGRSDYHIVFVASGKGYVRTNGAVTEVKKGDVLFYRPFQPQNYLFKEQDNYSYYYVHFTGAGFDKVVKGLSLENKNFFTLAHTSEIEIYIKRLCEVFTTKKKNYRLLTTGLLLSILALLDRYSCTDDRPGEEDTNGHSAVISDCIYYFKAYGLSWMDVRHMAYRCSLSVTHFTRLFKEFTGCSPGEFILNTRIETAKKQLIFTDFSVSQIAEAVGYSDHNYFTRIFKKRVGMTPTEFRKK